ncbi:hypothetical protein SAMN05660909_04278 [Chitinophaga terrae (ex Kim and Jung 2007)]|uniref:DUF4369 domain-containing protein n=2 Tax=Chitinophaga terrae (ex Kim and Jung 2007) TaxID=408074 RepID=A0A1H4FB92_9BACT|nr:DUF6263 family protein [Chitinophaga terrae (ex Kim and Jung 2007)]GEP92269.1 hypothetical protein CTE07_39140 [Chitinophaga terrae (ex Kim and Jung 2007)]SEA94237.1 hypothetical protein SAMN05660909_04278 [Chitinophaga terrae (ex Kim and Jung 2007)]
MKRIFGLLTFLFAFSIANAQQGGAYLDLSYTFHKGEVFELEQKSRTETYVTVDGVVQRTTRDYNNLISIEVTNIEPGKTTLTFKYKDLKFNFNAKNNNIFVDAKVSKPDEPFQGALKAILDQPFTVEIQTTGIINKVEGLDALVDKAGETFNTLKKDEQEAYKKLIKDQFGTDAFRGWLEQLFVMYPAHGIKTGTQWEENVPMRGDLVGRVDLYWTLQTWDSQTAKINGTAKMKTDKIQTIFLDDNVKATAEISGTTTSNYLINISSGLPSICVQNSEMAGDYTYIAKKIKNNKKVPAKIITNASYKIKQMK